MGSLASDCPWLETSTKRLSRYVDTLRATVS